MHGLPGEETDLVDVCYVVQVDFELQVLILLYWLCVSQLRTCACTLVPHSRVLYEVDAAELLIGDAKCCQLGSRAAFEAYMQVLMLSNSLFERAVLLSRDLQFQSTRTTSWSINKHMQTSVRAATMHMCVVQSTGVTRSGCPEPYKLAAAGRINGR